MFVSHFELAQLILQLFVLVFQTEALFLESLHLNRIVLLNHLIVLRFFIGALINAESQYLPERVDYCAPLFAFGLQSWSLCDGGRLQSPFFGKKVLDCTQLILKSIILLVLQIDFR